MSCRILYIYIRCPAEYYTSTLESRTSVIANELRYDYAQRDKLIARYAQVCECKTFELRSGFQLSALEKTTTMDSDEEISPKQTDESLSTAQPLTVRGRRKLTKELCNDIVPTKFDDDDDLPSEDENGEETLILQKGLFGGQDYQHLRSRCLDGGKLFVDPQFPSCKESTGLDWKRPAEICEDPRFFVDGGSRFDVKQGKVGDCWLLAAIANLTLHKKLFEQVVPHDQSFADGYAGIFHFRSVNKI